MRKQTKLAILVGAMSIAGAMTSFAATGWQQENGTWVYYDKNEEKVSQKWQQSGEYWYYLDDMGDMATDALIDDGNATYYVDINGAMVKNRWVAIPNTNDYDENEPDQWWYYFGANGKAYKRSDSATNDVSLKTINGKKYTFDTDGKMQYGWVKDGETQHDDNAWQDAEYYFGDENDGSMAEGWREIAIVDDQAADLQPGDNYWEEDQTRWFYFKASGKKEKNQTGKTINGRKYGFDEYGRMNAGWFTTATLSNATPKDDPARGTQGIATYSNSFLYYSTPEDGARSTKGWFKVTPGYYLQRNKYEDGSDYWYYSDGNGKLTVNEIKTINGKKYAFDNYGRMISGFVVLQMEGNTIGSGYSSKKIVQKVDSDGTYDTGDNYNRFVKANDSLFRSGELKSYFFGGSDDGSMKTGKQTVELDSEKYTFEFAKNGSNKGVGLNGMEDHKFYVGGKLTTADTDSKIEIVILDSSNKLVAKSSVEDALAAYGNGGVQHFKSNGDLDYTEYKFTGLPTGHKAYVVNTTGAMVKSGTKKDGDDYKVKTSNYTVDWVRLEE